MERYTYGAETQRSASRRGRTKRNDVGLALGRTFREMNQGEEPEKSSYRPFNRKAWMRSGRENLRPFPSLIFETVGGRSALQTLDAWAQVQLVRRATGDPSALPPVHGHGSIGAGFSIPDVALKAMSVQDWLQDQPAWVEKLLEFVFIDGWKPWQKEVVYLMPDPVKESRIRELEAKLRKWDAEPKELLEAAKKSELAAGAIVANVHREIRELHESMLIVLDAHEEAPVKAAAEDTMVVRRWCYDFAEFTWSTEAFELSPRGRRVLMATRLLEIVQEMAADLCLGTTMWCPRMRFVSPEVFDEGEG